MKNFLKTIFSAFRFKKVRNAKHSANKKVPAHLMSDWIDTKREEWRGLKISDKERLMKLSNFDAKLFKKLRNSENRGYYEK